MYKATVAKEITVETPNDLGVAAKIAIVVSKDAKTNIRTIWAHGMNGHGYFGIMTDDNAKALTELKKVFPSSKEVDVLMINTQDEVGEVADIANKICNAGININFLTATYIEGKPVVIVSTENDQKAQELFN